MTCWFYGLQSTYTRNCQQLRGTQVNNVSLTLSSQRTKCKHEEYNISFVHTKQEESKYVYRSTFPDSVWIPAPSLTTTSDLGYQQTWTNPTAIMNLICRFFWELNRLTREKLSLALTNWPNFDSSRRNCFVCLFVTPSIPHPRLPYDTSASSHWHPSLTLIQIKPHPTLW